MASLQSSAMDQMHSMEEIANLLYTGVQNLHKLNELRTITYMVEKMHQWRTRVQKVARKGRQVNTMMQLEQIVPLKHGQLNLP